jgi:hypothetical protein
LARFDTEASKTVGLFSESGRGGSPIADVGQAKFFHTLP